MSKRVVAILMMAALAVLAAAGGVYLFSRLKLSREEGKKEAAAPEIGVEFKTGVDLSNVGQATENPLKNMPAVNPLEEVANPFRDAYKNPFR